MEHVAFWVQKINRASFRSKAMSKLTPEESTRANLLCLCKDLASHQENYSPYGWQTDPFDTIKQAMFESLLNETGFNLADFFKQVVSKTWGKSPPQENQAFGTKKAFHISRITRQNTQGTEFCQSHCVIPHVIYTQRRGQIEYIVAFRILSAHNTEARLSIYIYRHRLFRTLTYSVTFRYARNATRITSDHHSNWHYHAT